MTDRIHQLARFNFRLFYHLPIEFERLHPDIQAKHLAMAEEVLNFMQANGWIREEKG